MPELNGWVGLCLTVMVLLIALHYFYEIGADNDRDR